MALTVVVGGGLFSCSADPRDDSGTGGGGTGGAGGASAGTGLALGSFCIQANGNERCELLNNFGRREVTSGNVALTIEHGTSFGCSGTAPVNLMTSTTIPNGVPLPYDGITRGTYHFIMPSNSCEWQRLGEAPASGIIYHAGAEGETQIEGELIFYNAPVYGTCGTSLDSCPQEVDVRFRFNLPL